MFHWFLAECGGDEGGEGLPAPVGRRWASTAAALRGGLPSAPPFREAMSHASHTLNFELVAIDFSFVALTCRDQGAHADTRIVHGRQRNKSMATKE